MSSYHRDAGPPICLHFSTLDRATLRFIFPEFGIRLMGTVCFVVADSGPRSYICAMWACIVGANLDKKSIKKYRKLALQFHTSCERIPIKGMSSIKYLYNLTLSDSAFYIWYKTLDMLSKNFIRNKYHIYRIFTKRTTCCQIQSRFFPYITYYCLYCIKGHIWSLKYSLTGYFCTVLDTVQTVIFTMLVTVLYCIG